MMKSIAVEMTLLVLVIFGGIASNIQPQMEGARNTSSFPAGYPSPVPYPTAYPTPSPFVVSSQLAEPDPYPAPSGGSIMRFNVTFSEDVRRVDITDFSLTVTGLTGSTILSVSGYSYLSIYTVTVNTGTGTGTIRLDVMDDDSIEDRVGNPLGGVGVSNGNFTSGEVYHVNVPLIIPSVGTYDGWILESAETSGVGGTLNKTATTLRVGDDAANKQYRAILSFDTSSLPEGAVITSVTLKFKDAGKTGTLPFNTHGNLLADICAGAFKNNPALQLADFNNRCPAGHFKVKGLIYARSNKVGDWYTQTLLPENFQYIDLGGVTQFRLRFARDDNNDRGADFLRVFSGNAAEADQPHLVIEFYLP